jgi:gliding motility-associated-like protein
LEVTAANGCTASGKVVIDLLIPISIPNAFTPNGDGRNDVFYIPQGAEGSMIRDFIVFNRWGEKMFEAHHVPPGDRASGWNGNYKGKPAAPGTYAYTINLDFGNGVSQTQRGVVILIR